MTFLNNLCVYAIKAYLYAFYLQQQLYRLLLDTYIYVNLSELFSLHLISSRFRKNYNTSVRNLKGLQTPYQI